MDNEEVKTAPFDGSDYSPEFDHTRLTKQIKRVYDCMKDGVWRTVGEIAVAIKRDTGEDDPENSIQAQLRNLRKEKYGKFLVVKRSRGDRMKALYEYHLSSPCKLDQPTLTETEHDADKAIKYQRKEEANKEKAAKKKKVEETPPAPVEPVGEKYVILTPTAAEQVVASEKPVEDKNQLSLFE